VSDSLHPERKHVRLATCGKCKAKNWLEDDHGPLVPEPCKKCGHPVIVPAPIRHFEVREVVASGGMGTVYRAFDTILGRMVAIKMLRRGMADDRQVMDSFYREARATAALNHTNIIHIYNFDVHEGAPFLVMELADHGSLDSWIERDQCVPELNVLDVGIKVIGALESALQRNLLHRDIKPGNILFDEYGEPKLVDFGLACAAENKTEYEAEIFGTPSYVAPEKVQRRGEDFRSDMYSLGGTLYHALIGQVPFEGDTIEQVVTHHVHTPLVPPNQLRPDVSQATSDAIVTAMAKDPAQRYATYADFKMALEASRSFLLVQSMQQGAEEAEQSPETPSAGGGSWWRRRSES
jgi:serine/threonine protein kinase